MPMSVTNRSASGMRFWSTSLGSVARVWTAKPCRVEAREQGPDLRVDVGFELAEQAFVLVDVADFHGFHLKACSEKANRGIPETTHPDP